jgi:DNA topoisomerase-1
MRTDSVRIAPESLQEARRYILSVYGKEYLTPEPRVFSSKKSAQDAHESIHPTNLNHPPEKIKAFLTRDQFNLYSLIWKRFISSQMMPAIYDTVSADISTNQNIFFRATGSTMKFPGFLAVYEEKFDEDDKDNENRALPPLEEGQDLVKLDLLSEQSFTKPPPRFSEASLVKELEKSGIGRPSTYATIMNKIQSREYTIKESQRLKPTELGKVIAQMLEASFQIIMNIGFTAEMEEDLERIAENKKEWKSVIREFWAQFMPTLEIAEKEAFVPKIMTDIDCPKCGSKLQKIWAKGKYFYGCSTYPECDYASSADELSFNKDDYDPNFAWDQPCPKCSSPMKIRHGRFGAFLGCTRYPDCKGIVNIPKKGEAIIEENAPPCPAIGCDGVIKGRKSRFGKIFYSCSNYPDCDVIVNQLEQLDTKYSNHPKTPYVKKSKFGAKGSKKGEAKTPVKKTAAKKAPAKKTPSEKPKRTTSTLFNLSPELSAIVGSAELGRQETLKKLWEYIKANNLQSPENKKLIVPDAKLSKVIGPNPIDMFKLPGALSSHIQRKTS